MYYREASARQIHFSLLGACVRQRNLNKEELISLISFLLPTGLIFCLFAFHTASSLMFPS